MSVSFGKVLGSFGARLLKGHHAHSTQRNRLIPSPGHHVGGVSRGQDTYEKSWLSCVVYTVCFFARC